MSRESPAVLVLGESTRLTVPGIEAGEDVPEDHDKCLCIIGLAL